jgi:hypothetical protein
LPKSCIGALPSPVDGSVSDSSSAHNVNVTVQCDAGFEAQPSTAAAFQCQFGQWVGSLLANDNVTYVMPTCQPRQCGAAPVMPAGSVSSQSALDGSFGQTLTYQCSGGYSLGALGVDSATTITCQANGTWSTLPGASLLLWLS